MAVTSPAGRRRDRALVEYGPGVTRRRGVGPALAGHVLLLAIAAFFVSFVVWAGQAPLDEVTRGDGRVIPSRQIQVVQNLEGGIVAQILVRDGDTVEQDQILMKIDNVRISSDYREKRARYIALVAAENRLDAETRGTSLAFDPEVQAEAPGIVAYETALFASRRAALDDQLAVLGRQKAQREQELVELESRLAALKTTLGLAEEEYRISEPLAAQRILPRTEVLRLQRQVVELRSEMEQAQLAIPRVKLAIQEAQGKIDGTLSAFRSEALAELTAKLSELTGLREIVSAGEDRVRRTEVRSPVRGTVKQVKVATIGGVIQPGQDLVEIVPLEDNLLVEAMVRPADIAFVRPGLDAMVKVTAYDFAIYGGLLGTVEDISADTIRTENGEAFYRMRVRTDRSWLGSEERKLEIIPGMTAQVDVLTGQKTVLDYLMKPILKARQNALRER
jgi:adhesin transport system membrane fusion protein